MLAGLPPLVAAAGWFRFDESHSRLQISGREQRPGSTERSRPGVHDSQRRNHQRSELRRGERGRLHQARFIHPEFDDGSLGTASMAEHLFDARVNCCWSNAEVLEEAAVGILERHYSIHARKPRGPYGAISSWASCPETKRSLVDCVAGNSSTEVNTVQQRWLASALNSEMTLSNSCGRSMMKLAHREWPRTCTQRTSLRKFTKLDLS